MKVQVLGMGCAKCAKLYEEIKKLAVENGLDIDLEKVEDLQEIMAAGVMSTPGLVIDGQVKATGRIPDTAELKSLLGLG